MNASDPTEDKVPDEKEATPDDPTRLISVDATIDAIAKRALEEARAREARNKIKQNSP